jgi:hypothetical protein
MNEEALLASIPAAAARAFRKALAAKEWKDARAGTVAALEAVGYPEFARMANGSWKYDSRADRTALVALGKKHPHLADRIAKHLGRVKVTKLVFERITVERGMETDLQKKQLAPLVKEYGDDARDAELCEVLGRTEDIVFKGGTTKKVATLIQGGAEVSSVALAISLEDALDAYRKQIS